MSDVSCAGLFVVGALADGGAYYVFVAQIEGCDEITEMAQLLLVECMQLGEVGRFNKWEPGARRLVPPHELGGSALHVNLEDARALRDAVVEDYRRSTEALGPQN